MEREKKREEAPNPKKKAGELQIDLSTNVPSKIPDRIRRVIRSLRDYIRRKDREPLIGLEYILQYRVQLQPEYVTTKFFCELCDLNSELVPMIEHLSGSRHRKLYLAKEFPYVLKAPPCSKEDRNQFLRRMALEIEQDIGLKDFKSDPVIRPVSLMNVKNSEARLSQRNSRWQTEGDRQVRMKKALEFLDSIQIDNDEDEARATKLTERLTSELKAHYRRVTQEALFPAKVARAKDVAASIMQKATRERMSKPKPLLTSHPGSQVPPHTFFMGEPLVMPAANSLVPGSDPNAEDVRFLKKLKNFLSVIPQNAAPPESSSLSSKLLMLKSLLEKRGGENMAGGRPISTHSTAGAENPLKQKILALLASQNPAVLSQLDPNMIHSEGGNVPPTEDAQTNQNRLLQLLLQSRQKSGTMEAETLPSNQNIPDQGYGPMDRNRKGPMNANAFADAPMEPLPAGPRSYLPEHRYPSDPHRKEWEGQREDCTADRTPHTRIAGAARPRNERFRESNSGRGLRRPAEDPEWLEGDTEARREKRTRREEDYFTRSAAERGEQHQNQSGPNLSVDLLKRIRGKDMFTVSAILSEYAEK